MNPEKCRIKAEFLEHQGRRLFYLLLQPAAEEPCGSVLFLPPFTEEMHKSRHIVASQARELAEAGYNVMLLDLTGCGDSSGSFADASWRLWQQDAALAADTLRQLSNTPLILWGLRMGALLAGDLARERSDVKRLVLWQPMLNGEQQIDQFLRLQTAASALNGKSTFERTAMWNELRSGGSLNIAGYELASALALEMARIRLNDINVICPVDWIEVGGSPSGSVSLASENVIAHWRDRGGQVDVGYVQGEPFWRTVDARLNPELQRFTTARLVS